MTHLDTSERLAAATLAEETAALATGDPAGETVVAGDQTGGLGKPSDHGASDPVAGLGAGSNLSPGRVPASDLAAGSAAAGPRVDSGGSSGEDGDGAARSVEAGEMTADDPLARLGGVPRPSPETTLPVAGGVNDLRAGQTVVGAASGAGPGNPLISGSPAGHEPAPAENRAVRELADPLPSQFSSLAVAALRAELSETQRQVEVISDAFAQAVDVIAETLAPAESHIRETVATALAQESAALRQALAAEWSERAGQVDQRVADQMAMLAAAMESWRKELAAQLAQEIRSLQAPSGPGFDQPVRLDAGAPPAEHGAAQETNEATPWLVQLEARIKASIQQEVAAALGPRLAELTDKIRDLAPGSGPQPIDVTPVVERLEALIQSLTAQPASAAAGSATSPDRRTEIAEKLDHLQTQFSQDLDALEAHLVSAMKAQLAPAMEAQLVSGFENQLRDQLARQQDSLEARLRTTIEGLTERLRADLDRLAPPAPSDTAAVEVEIVANAVKTIAAELTDLRQQLHALASRPSPTVDANSLAQPLSAAFEKLDQTVGERLNALFDAVREELSSNQDARTRAIRRELDRVLYIATGLFGLLGGGFLWLLLRPS